MSDIGPGDFVECIDAHGEDGGRLYDGGFLVEGRIYRIASFGAVEDCPSVRLVGQPHLHGLTGRPGAYAIRRFRPVYRPNDGLIIGLLKPVKEQEPA